MPVTVGVPAESSFEEMQFISKSTSHKELWPYASMWSGHGLVVGSESSDKV